MAKKFSHIKIVKKKLKRRQEVEVREEKRREPKSRR
jgi:hypothetical protein